MSSPHITYAARAEVTPEAELSALVNVYKFVLDCHAKKRGARADGPDDAIVRNTEEVRHVDRRPN